MDSLDHAYFKDVLVFSNLDILKITFLKRVDNHYVKFQYFLKFVRRLGGLHFPQKIAGRRGSGYEPPCPGIRRLRSYLGILEELLEAL